MARLLSIGFELQSVVAGIEFDASNGSGSKSISTGVYRGGLASLRVNPSGSYWFLGHQYRSNASTSKVYARFCIYIGTYPGAPISIFAFAASTTGGNSGGQLQLNSDGTLQLGYYNGTWNSIGSPSQVLARGVWYRIELSYDDSDGNNTVTARVEGKEFATGNGNNLGGNGCIQLGDLFDSDTFDINFDDVAVNDESGSFQNSWPGNGKIIHLEPNASGDANSFATQTGGTGGASNNYTRVSETSPDDDTTYNGSSTLNEEDLFNLDVSGISADDVVKLVSVGMRFKNSVADASAEIKAEIIKTTGGTKTQSSGIVPNSTSWRTNSIADPKSYPLTLYQDPDSATWTKTTLDSMQVGYKLTTAPGTAGRRIDVSKVWALVEYAVAKVETLVETFNDNVIDTELWNEYETSGGVVEETNQEGHETLAANTNGSWAGYHSKRLYDLTDSSIFMQIVSATTGNSWLDLNISNEPIPIVDNFLAIGVNVGTQRLEVVEEIEGEDTVLTDIAYNPSTMKWVRIRESGGTIYWEYSADCVNWTTLHSATSIVPVSNIYVVIDDYEYDALSTPNTHIVDNVNNQVLGTTKSFTVDGIIVDPTVSFEGGGTALAIRSIDVMKWTKDTLTNQPTGAQIQAIVNTLATNFNLTHISIAVPMDGQASYEEVGVIPGPLTAEGFLAAWITAIHDAGLGVLYRGTLNGVERSGDTALWNFKLLVGTNRLPQGTDTSAESDGSTTLLGKVRQFLVNTQTLWRDGDIFAPMPERTENNTIETPVLSITRSGNIATLTTTGNHNIGNGQPFRVSGANESDYNGSFIATKISDSVLQYTVANTPSTPATGTILAGFGVSPYTDAYSIFSNTGSGVNANYAEFFNDLKLVADDFFQNHLGIQVTTGYTANNYTEVNSGWLFNSIFDAAGVVSIDHYGTSHTPEEMDSNLRSLYTSKGHPIVLQEWADYWNGAESQAVRTLYLRNFYAMLGELVDDGILTAFNYWGGWVFGEGEGILTDLSAGSAYKYGITYYGQILAEFFEAVAPPSTGIHDLEYGWFLNDVQLKRPQGFKPEPIYQKTDYVMIDGKNRRDTGNRKEKYMLDFRYLTKDEIAAIDEICELGIAVPFRVNVKNKIVIDTMVFPYVGSVVYDVSGADYRGSLQLELIEQE